MNLPEPRETNHEWFCDKAKGLTGECNCDQKKTMTTLTPETDAEVKRNEGKVMSISSDFARKLERERDEARDANRRANELIGNQAQENDKINSTLQAELTQLRNQVKNAYNYICLNHTDRERTDLVTGCPICRLQQLRKVCDDMASEKCQCVLCMENDLVLHHYSTLPHVIKAKANNRTELP